MILLESLVFGWIMWYFGSHHVFHDLPPFWKHFWSGIIAIPLAIICAYSLL